MVTKLLLKKLPKYQIASLAKYTNEKITKDFIYYDDN